MHLVCCLGHTSTLYSVHICKNAKRTTTHKKTEWPFGMPSVIGKLFAMLAWFMPQLCCRISFEVIRKCFYCTLTILSVVREKYSNSYWISLRDLLDLLTTPPPPPPPVFYRSSVSLETRCSVSMIFFDFRFPNDNLRLHALNVCILRSTTNVQSQLVCARVSSIRTVIANSIHIVSQDT